MAGGSCVRAGCEERSCFLGMRQPSLGSVNLTSLTQGSQRDVCAGDREGEEEEGGEEEEEEARTTFPMMLFNKLRLQIGHVLGVLHLALVRWQWFHRSKTVCRYCKAVPKCVWGV